MRFRKAIFLGFFLSFSLTELNSQDYVDETVFSSVTEKLPASSYYRAFYKQYLDNANHYFKQGLYREARQLFWRAIHLYPQNPDAYINLAIVHMQEQDLDSALRLLKKAETLAKEDYYQTEILFYNLGLCFFKKGDYQNALTYLKKALRTYPNFASAYYYLGVTYEKLGQNEKAFASIFMAEYLFKQQANFKYAQEAKKKINNFERRAKLDKTSLAESFLRAGRKAIGEQDLDKAVALFQKSIFLNPQNIDAYYELALLYSRQQAFHNVIIYLNRIIEVDPKFLKAYLDLSQAYRKIEKYDLAMETLQRAAKLDEENPLIYYNLGLTCIDAGEFQTARRYLFEAKRGALTEKDMSLLEKIRTASDIVEERQSAEKTPPYYPKKVKRKAAEPLYPYYPLKVNRGNLNKGYFIPQPDLSKD